MPDPSPGAAPDIMKEALALHQAGRAAEAEALYRRVLDDRPDDGDALHLLGLLAGQAGDLEKSAGLIERAIAARPDEPQYHANLGTTFAQLRRWQPAEAAYRRALSLKPDFVEALYSLGAIVQRQGRAEEAAGQYRRALEADPRFLPAYNNLGVVLLGLGQAEAAIDTYRKALAIEPDLPDVLVNLGNALRDRDELDEAIDCYRRALDITDRSAQTHYNLGVALKEQGDVEGAIACYRRALEIDPKHAKAHNNLGMALQASGRFEDADASYRTALEIRPGYAMACKNLVSLGRVEPDDPLTGRIEALLEGNELSDGDSRLLHFALGKCFDDTGDYDRAFRHYQAANDIHETRRPFDPGVFTAITDRLIETFGQTFFEAKAGFGSESERPVFIVGMPRSGTTLIEQILASHGQVHGAGELSNFNRMAADLPALLGAGLSYPDCAAAIDRERARGLAQGYLDHLARIGGDATRVTDKMPRNFRHLGLIALLLPRARVIHCRRESMDVCLSCYAQDFLAQPFSHDLGHIGLYYREYERLMAHWRAVLPLPVLEVRYEALVSDPEGVSRGMIEFCGLDWDPACLDFHRTQRPILTASLWQARQPLYDSAIGRWKNYEAHLAPLKAALEGVHSKTR